AGSAGSHCQNEANAGDGRDRGHPDDDSVASEDPGRPGLRRRAAQHPFHGPVPTQAPRAVARRIRLILPRLYAIVDVETAERAGWAPRALARTLVSAGCRLLQVRS